MPTNELNAINRLGKLLLQVSGKIPIGWLSNISYLLKGRHCRTSWDGWDISCDDVVQLKTSHHVHAVPALSWRQHTGLSKPKNR